MDERYIAAADLGTSKIALAVARVEGDNVQVIYYDEEPSEGMLQSYIFNPKKLAAPLGRIISKAENELGIKILQLVSGLPRYYVRQEIATGELPRTNPGNNITAEEISSLKNMALDNYPLEGADKEIIYGAVAQSFSTDDFHQIKEEDVEGMVSDIFEGNFKIFIGKRKNVTNMDMVFNDLGIASACKYFSPDSLAKIVLTSEEMDNGVALIDLGGGVSSVSVYKNGILRHYGAIPFGGKTITSDIKNEGGFSMDLAESIKIAYGACMPDKLASMSEKVLVIRYKDRGSEKQLSVRYLSEIITARATEIINALLWEIQSSGFADELRSGVVITGGGAELVNIGNLIRELSGYNVRTGYPMHKYSCEGCAGVGETSSASVLGMLISAKNEFRTLNCLTAPPRIVEKDEETDPGQRETDGTNFDSVFNKDAWEKAPDAKKPKKSSGKTGGIGKSVKDGGKKGGTWKVITKLGDLFEKAYSEMEEEDNERI